MSFEYPNILSTDWVFVNINYQASVNNYFDNGYPVRFGETAAQSSITINTYMDAVATRYSTLVGLQIARNNTTYFNSAIDQCKGSVTVNNIDSLCRETHLGTNHTLRGEVINDFSNNVHTPGSNTVTNAYWSGHRITSFDDPIFFGDNRSCSSGTNIFMIALSGNREYIENVLMHELNHQYGAPDHYHELSDNNDPNSCKHKSICSNIECGNNPRPATCIMNSSRNIFADTVLCISCKTEMVTHLENHHKY